MDAHTSGGHATGAPAVTVSARTRHATWLAALFVIAFLTPYVLADTLEIQRDVYYALYGGIAITFAWAWDRATEQSWGQMIARRWRLTLLLAALGGAVLIPAAIADTVAPPVDMLPFSHICSRHGRRPRVQGARRSDASLPARPALRA